MPYKFKSRATADLIMLDANGRKLLEIIGKSPDEVHGIITVEQIPAAIQALRAEVARQDAERKAAPQAHEKDDVGDQVAEEQGKSDTVLFSQRVTPLIKLMELSLADGKGVIWGA